MNTLIGDGSQYMDNISSSDIISMATYPTNSTSVLGNIAIISSMVIQDGGWAEMTPSRLEILSEDGETIVITAQMFARLIEMIQKEYPEDFL